MKFAERITEPPQMAINCSRKGVETAKYEVDDIVQVFGSPFKITEVSQDGHEIRYKGYRKVKKKYTHWSSFGYDCTEMSTTRQKDVEKVLFKKKDFNEKKAMNNLIMEKVRESIFLATGKKVTDFTINVNYNGVHTIEMRIEK